MYCVRSHAQLPKFTPTLWVMPTWSVCIGWSFASTHKKALRLSNLVFMHHSYSTCTHCAELHLNPLPPGGSSTCQTSFSECKRNSDDYLTLFENQIAVFTTKRYIFIHKVITYCCKTVHALWCTVVLGLPKKLSFL